MWFGDRSARERAVVSARGAWSGDVVETGRSWLTVARHGTPMVLPLRGCRGRDSSVLVRATRVASALGVRGLGSRWDGLWTPREAVAGGLRRAVWARFAIGFSQAE
jgi:hypothetical protein